MAKSKSEHEHVTFPLSLTQREKEEYAEFCKSKEQTMAGRIKELMRRDMGLTVLSSFKEKYQTDIIEAIQKVDHVLVIKSRQMWMSTLLLSISLDGMLRQKKKDKPYSCFFICVNKQNADELMRKFLKICDDHNIKVLEGRTSSHQVYLTNGSYIHFMSKLPLGQSGTITVFDEFAFMKSTKEEIGQLQAAGGKVVISSTPRKKSLFNELAKEAINGKNFYFPAIAHWTMNSVQSHNASMMFHRNEDNTFKFSMCNKELYDMMGKERYMEEMECVLL